MSAILVTGGTGTLGRALVPRLAAAGHQVTVLSRRARPASSGPANLVPAGSGPAGTEPASSGHASPVPAGSRPPGPGPDGWVTGDLHRGDTIAAAVAGAEVIVHCATSMSGEVAAARNLIAAARRAGGPHLAYISIVGVDQVPFFYYRSKLAAERPPAAADATGPDASGAVPVASAMDPEVSGARPAASATNPDVSGSRPGGRTRRLVRAGLILLAVIQAGQGAWQYFAPRSFYDVIPTVAADPPFNGHLLTDVGGLNLALAVVLAAAAWRLDRTLTRVGLAAYLVYSGSHLAFHAADQARLAGGSRALLITSLALLPALAVGLLVLITRPGAAGPPDQRRDPRGPLPGAAIGTLPHRGQRQR